VNASLERSAIFGHFRDGAEQAHRGIVLSEDGQDEHTPILRWRWCPAQWPAFTRWTSCWRLWSACWRRCSKNRAHSKRAGCGLYAAEKIVIYCPNYDHCPRDPTGIDQLISQATGKEVLVRREW